MNEKVKIIETKQTVKDQMSNLMKQQEQINMVGQGILFGVCAEKGVNPNEYAFNDKWDLQERPKKENNEPENPAD